MVRQKFISASKISDSAGGLPLYSGNPNPSWTFLESALGETFPTGEGLWHINGQCLSEKPEVIVRECFDRLGDFPGQIIVHTFFQHPSQCSLEAFDACARVADAGLILSNSMLLQLGVNDSSAIVKELNHKLLMMRVRPYTINVRSDQSPLIEAGKEILDNLRGWTSGLAVPHFVILENDGSQKVMIPEYIKSYKNQIYVFRNYRKDEYEYREQ